VSARRRYRRRRYGVKAKHCKAHLRWKKDIELQENGRYLYGLADVTSPTQDARCVANVNIGPRFTYWVRALKKVMITSAATLQPDSLAARATQLGSCGPDMPYLENHLAPVAVRSHYEYYEVCNLNKGAMRLSVSCWKWKPGFDYSEDPLSIHVQQLQDQGHGRIMFQRSTDPSGQLNWKGVAVPSENKDGFGMESLFPARRGHYDRQFIKKIWHKEVVLPASSSFKFKVRIPRMWPVYEEDITHLHLLCKNKVDRCIRYEWSSLCGIVPTADETKDPVVTDIHTEKMILAVRQYIPVSAVRYFMEPPLQIRVDDIWNYTDEVPPRGPSNRATTFKIHRDAEKVAGVPGQASA